MTNNFEVGRRNVILEMLSITLLPRALSHFHFHIHEQLNIRIYVYMYIKYIFMGNNKILGAADFVKNILSKFECMCGLCVCVCECQAKFNLVEFP